MPAPAAPLIEMLQLAAAAFAEGQSVLTEAAELQEDGARPSLAYGHQTLSSGFIQLEAVARRYISQPECASGTPAKPILADPGFRAAVIACADQLDRSAPFVGVPGRRIAVTLRRWINDNNPIEARLVAMSCDAAARMSKMCSGRAA